jgi:uncharacterized protein with PIN domain
LLSQKVILQKGELKMLQVIRGEGPFIRYRYFRGYRILSGCLYCQGALFMQEEKIKPDITVFYKCFNCGRMYLRENSHIILWPYREYEHLKGKKVAQKK